MPPITPAQDLYLRLIGASGQWNAFNGPAIEDSLRANCGLWRAALLTSEVSGMRSEKPPRLRDTVDLVVLRDLPKNAVTLSTLFLLAEPGKQDSLEALAQAWEADELHWIDQDEAFAAMGEGPSRNRDYLPDPRRVILRVWWD